MPRLKKYGGWFICDKHLIFGMRNHETLLKRTKHGIPKGALQYESKEAAETEIRIMDHFGIWPLFIPGAKAEYLTWS